MLNVQDAGVSVCGALDCSAVKPYMVVGVNYAKRGLRDTQFLPRCIECIRGLAMRTIFCLSVCPSVKGGSKTQSVQNLNNKLQYIRNGTR